MSHPGCWELWAHLGGAVPTEIPFHSAFAVRPAQEQPREGWCPPQAGVLLFAEETPWYPVCWDLSLTAEQGKWGWSHLSLGNTKLPGLPKPGAKSQCSIFPRQTCCFIYFHSMNTNTANPLKHKWLPTPYLQFMFIPTLLDNFCSFSSLLLHSLVKNSKALNQSQKFNLKFHVDPALKEHVSSFRARMITKSIHLFPFPSPELSLAACESEV